MSPLVKVNVKLFFEISDSYIYGGPGSKGYSMTSMDVDESFFEHADESEASQREGMAVLMQVPLEAVRLISEQEYNIMTADNTKDGKTFPELFVVLRGKDLNAGMQEAYYRLYQKNVDGMENCGEMVYRDWLKKRSRQRTHLRNVAGYLAELGVISPQYSRELQMQLSEG